MVSAAATSVRASATMRAAACAAAAQGLTLVHSSAKLKRF